MNCLKCLGWQFVYNKIKQANEICLFLTNHSFGQELFDREVHRYLIVLLDQELKNSKNISQKDILYLKIPENEFVKVGTQIDFRISNGRNFVEIDFCVNEESLNFFNKWKLTGAILKLDSESHCQFSIN